MRQFLLLIYLSLIITTAFASPKKGKQKLHVFPVPDALIASLAPESILQPNAEASSSLLVKRNNTQGIDVSHYQGLIDWQRVSNDDQVAYCYIKATENTSYVDDCYERNLREARKHGVKVGAYHFFSPTTSPVEQLRNMTNVVKKQDQDLIPLIDVEKIGKRANVNAFRQRLKVFLDGAEKHYGIRPLIYTGQNFFNKYLAGHFSDYRFMIAKYQDEPPVIHDKKAEVLMWQYSCTGRISGIHGDCDQSIFLENYDLKDILIK